MEEFQEVRYSDLSYCERLDLAIDNILAMDPFYRPLDSNNQPGGLIEFPEDDPREFLFAGDLHGNKKNLKAILMDEQNLYKIKRNEAVLIILGDAVHVDQVGRLAEMESSIAIMDIVIHLINEYPDNVIYILGNHDTFSPRLSKNGIQQGLLYHKEMMKQRGKKYVELMKEFHEALPIFIKHPDFLAVHAGPVRGGINRESLINIRQHKDLLWQLLWNRLNETRSYPSKKEYGPYDLERMRMMLNVDQSVPVIVGHNPLWKIKSDDSVWIDVLNTKAHVILYSNMPELGTYVSIKNGEVKVKHANLKLPKKRFLLGNY